MKKEPNICTPNEEITGLGGAKGIVELNLGTHGILAQT